MAKIKLSKKEPTQKGRHLVSLIEGDIRNRSDNIKQHYLLRNLYYDLGVRNLEYAGQSDIHIPLIAEKVEGITPKVMNAFWQADPHVHAYRISTEADSETTKLVERYLNWAIETDIPDFYATFESWVRNTLIDGVSVLKPWYNRKFRHTTIRKSVDPWWHAGGIDFIGMQVPEDRMKIPEDILIEVLGTDDFAITERDDESATYSVSFRSNGIPYDAEVSFGPADRVDELEVTIYRPILIRENVEVDLLEFEDIIVPYRTASLQDVERVTQQYWLTLPELRERMRDDGWDITESEFADLRAGVEGKVTQEELLENEELRTQKDQVTGELSQNPDGPDRQPMEEDSPKAYLKNKLLMFEVYARDDLDGNGRYEEVVYQIPYGLRKIVDARYLDDIYPHGRRPFVDLHYVRISDRFYSIGVAEQLAAINMEVDAIVNDVHESQELINHPFGFYEPAASTADPKLLEDIPKGKLIPTANARGIVFPQFPQQPLANLSAVDSILLFADRLTQNPQAMGSSQVRNAPRTARGTLALLSESAVKTDMFITAAQKGPWRELIHQIHELYVSYGPKEKFFQVVGHPYTEKITPEELRGRYVYGFTGNTVNTNREVKRTLEQVLYNTLMQNPLVLQDPNAMQAITERFIKAFAEGTDTDVITPRPFGSGGLHPPMTQEAENQVMLQGGSINVLPNDDHAAHMAVIDRLRRTQEFEDADTWKVALIANHYSQHAQILMQLVQQGAGGQRPGMGNNVPTGMTLAQTDINALEGGVQ